MALGLDLEGLGRWPDVASARQRIGLRGSWPMRMPHELSAGRSPGVGTNAQG
jgi:hypothetical protein